jgi:hypothetical protein
MCRGKALVQRISEVRIILLRLLCLIVVFPVIVFGLTQHSVILTTSPNPSTYGQPVTLDATVSSGVIGSVTFLDGTNVLGTSTLVDGRALLTVSLLQPGARSLRAQYNGDSNLDPKTSAPQFQTVVTGATNGMLLTNVFSPGGYVAWQGYGDLNNDGRADLVIAGGSRPPGTSRGTGIINVLLANGDGSFRTAGRTVLADYPGAAVLGDFNGDGKTDLAVSTSYGLYMLLGNADGTFGSALQLNGLSFFGEPQAADFNGDGKLDLVGSLGNSGVLLLGNGDGTFRQPILLWAGPAGVSCSPLAVADIDGDGKADLVNLCAGTQGRDDILVQLGNGDGTFQLAVASPMNSGGVQLGNGDGTFLSANPVASNTAGASSAPIVLGDFNGDGRLDLVSGSTFWNSLLAGDFNGDGKLDIAYTGYTNSFDPNTANIQSGNGDGSFGPIVSILSMPAGHQCRMAQGDFNGDGKMDLVIGDSAEVDILLGGQYAGLNISVSHAGNLVAGQMASYQITVADPRFGYLPGIRTVTDILPPGLTASSISGSRWNCSLSTLTCTSPAWASIYPTIDIVAKVEDSILPSVLTDRASVSINNIVNTASDATEVLLPAVITLTASPNPTNSSQAITMTATVTRGAAGTVLFCDGVTPLGSATINHGQATFTTRLLMPGQHSLMATYSGDPAHAPASSAIRLQTVNPSTGSGFRAAAKYDGGPGPSAVAIADFNKDGRVDLVTVNSAANAITVLLGQGDGTFGPGINYSVGAAPGSVVAADFNNDGKPDIAVANQDGSDVSVLLNNDNGIFGAQVRYATGAAPRSLWLGDFNGDGKTDLLVLNAGDGTITLLFGRGDGTFRAAATPLVLPVAVAIAVADFNHDGKADIAYISGADWNGVGVGVWLGNGDGTFQQSAYSNFGRPQEIALGDLNADGNMDIAVTNYTSPGYPGSISVLLGKGDGTFQRHVDYATKVNSQATSILCADVNGDGKFDVVANVIGIIDTTTTVWLANSDGTLQAPTSLITATNLRGMAAGDFDGDGTTDLAVTNPSANNVTILLGAPTPSLSVSSWHSDPFIGGQAGAVYTLGVANRGPVASSGPVTLTDTLPSGMTASAIAGEGWNCALATLMCTRSDSLAANASYPVVTISVTVSVRASMSGTNQVSVEGGGLAGTSFGDVTSIVRPTSRPVLSRRRGGPV